MSRPESHVSERFSRLAINAAYFCGLFTIAQIAEYIGDQLHNPDVMDVPHGGVIAIGLGAAALGTTIIDHFRQSP